MPGSSSTHYTVSPLHLRVPTLGELDEGAPAGQPQRRRRGQGPLRGNDVGAAGRPALVLGRQDIRHRPEGRRDAPLGRGGQRRRSRARSPGSAGAASARHCASARRASFRSKAEALRSAAAPSPARPATCAISAPARIRRRDAGAGRVADRGNAAWARLLDRHHLDRTERRLTMSATRYGTEGAEMCLQLFSLDRDLGDFFRLLDSRGNRLCCRADRRPWRARHSGAQARQGRARRGAGGCQADSQGRRRRGGRAARSQGTGALRRGELRRHLC